MTTVEMQGRRIGKPELNWLDRVPAQDPSRQHAGVAWECHNSGRGPEELYTVVKLLLY